ncbi:MAG TPA: carbohydrate ABC transporter permease [Bacteroidota bacterium]|jgi:multiple sugar transport system permease protein|nr:carbohydrate ABC transporter permease [Bacteroidota bacterium]
MKTSLKYIALLFGAALFAYPFLWMIAGSLKPELEIARLSLWSSSFTTESYRQVLTKLPIVRAFFNSILVSLSVTASVVLFGSMVGYALSRLRFKGSNLLYLLILFTMMIPAQLTLIPQYVLMVKIGWIDTYASLIAPGMMTGFSIVLFRQFFMSVPQALVDAARIDGCSDLRILFRIIWPISRPVIITVAILTFMASWNEVLWPLLVVRERSLMTMPQLVTLFVIGGQAESQLGALLAAATLLALPVIIAYAFFQRYFIESMASTGIKG